MIFEGEEVDAARVTLRQFKGHWPIENPLLVDDEIVLQVKVKVAEVSHQVNAKDGNLYRTHVLHVQDIASGETDE